MPTQFLGHSQDASGTGGSDIPVGVLQRGVNSGVWGVVGVEGRTLVNRTTTINATSYVSADTANRGSAKPGTVSDGGILLGEGGDGANPTLMYLRLGG
jgi:hypothetical protein